jgi:hypothetical protein
MIKMPVLTILAITYPVVLMIRLTVMITISVLMMTVAQQQVAVIHTSTVVMEMFVQ